MNKQKTTQQKQTQTNQKNSSPLHKDTYF